MSTVIGLPLILRHGCWICKERGQVVVRWGAAAFGAQLAGTRLGDTQPVGTRPGDAELRTTLAAATVDDRDFVAVFCDQRCL